MTNQTGKTLKMVLTASGEARVALMLPSAVDRLATSSYAEAHRMYAYVMKIRRTKRYFLKYAPAVKVGGRRIRVRRDGLHIGCQTIPFPAIDNFARVQGWAKPKK